MNIQSVEQKLAELNQSHATWMLRMKEAETQVNAHAGMIQAYTEVLNELRSAHSQDTNGTGEADAEPAPRLRKQTLERR